MLLALLGVMLADFYAGGFGKMPFTCSYRPGRGNVQFALWGALVLLPLSVLGATYEWRALQMLRGELVLSAALIVPAIVVRWCAARRVRLVEELQFEDVEEPAIVSLQLVTDAVLSANG